MWNVRFASIVSLLYTVGVHVYVEESKRRKKMVVLPPHTSVKSDVTYVNDEEVEPTPGVGEVLDEAVRHPLEQHLQDENVSEDLVCIFQDRLDVSPTLNVNVLESLRSIRKKEEGIGYLFWEVSPSFTVFITSFCHIYVLSNSRGHGQADIDNYTVAKEEEAQIKERILDPLTALLRFSQTYSQPGG